MFKIYPPTNVLGDPILYYAGVEGITQVDEGKLYEVYISWYEWTSDDIVRLTYHGGWKTYGIGNYIEFWIDGKWADEYEYSYVPGEEDA